MQNNSGLNGFRSWWTKHREKINKVLALAGPVGIIIGLIADAATGNRLEYEFDLPLTAGE